MSAPDIAEDRALWHLLDAIPHVVWVLNTEGHAEYLNQAGRDTLGGVASVPADVAWARTLHPEDAWHLQHEWSPRRTSLQPFDRTIRLRHGAGEYRAFEMHATIAGGMWVLTCTLKPVAQDVDAAELDGERERALQRFRSLVAALSEFVWVTDQNGEVISDITGLAEYTAPNEPNMTFTAWLDRVHPEDRQRVEQVWRASVRTGTPITIEYRMLEPDGSILYAAVRGVPVRNTSGQIEEWVGVLLDLTQSWRAETELRRGENRLRSLIAAISELVWTVDPSGHPTSASGGEDFIHPGKPLELEEWLTHVHPEDREQLVSDWDAARETGSPLDSRYRLKRRDGSWSHVVNRGVPVRDKEGRIEEWVGVLFDVTLEREATLALEHTVRELEYSRHQARQDHALLETLIQNAPIGIAFVDTEFRVLNANRAIADAVGVGDRRRAIGERLPDLLPESWARVGDHMQEVRDTGRPVFNVPTSVERPAGSGQMQHRLSSFYPVQSQGHVIGLGIIVIDVTQQKQTEQALVQERGFLELILESVDDGILVCNAEGMLTKINRASRDFHGMAEPTLMPASEWPRQYCLFHSDGVTPMTLEELPLYRALQGETLGGVELVIQPEGAPSRRMLVRGKPLTSSTGERLGAVVVTQDITEKRELETRLRHAQKMDAVGQLAGGVAHDFNNLLTVVAGASELLLEKLLPGSESHHLVQEIALAGERATGLTRQLLAFGRRTVLALRVLALNDIVSETEKMLRRLLGEDVALVTRLGRDLPPVRVDAGQMAQVLVNLAVNARDAMPRGGTLTIATRACLLDDNYAGTHPGVEPGEYVLLSVTDSGVGMTDEVRQRIFEPFFTTKAPGKGTGLGLATVYGIVKQGGGHISVQSSLGHGATFEIYLPVASAERTSGGQAIVVVPEGGSETILLVEDEPSVRNLARHALVALGYNVMVAQDGIEALVLADVLSQDLDLLITDVVMPEMGGLELSRRLRARQPSLRVLFVSGYTDDAMVRHGVLADEVDFLQKPFGASVLARRVRQALDTRSA